MKRLLLFVVKVYRYAISPFMAPCCRFFPTCSSYALEAIERHGAIKGSWYSLRRICRGHPWHPGGYDPVPDPIERRDGR